MAENECGMQRNLNLLNEYCNCNGLRVNTRKTKIMVFARSKTRLRNLPTFKFGNLDLDLVDDYVYFDICFNWNGSFVKAKQLLHDKASKAMYSLIQKGRRLKLPIKCLNCLTVVWHPFHCMDVKCGVMKIPISLKRTYKVL